MKKLYDETTQCIDNLHEHVKSFANRDTRIHYTISYKNNEEKEKYIHNQICATLREQFTNDV